MRRSLASGWHLRVVILVSLILHLIHDLTLEFTGHLVHHGILPLGHLQVHHDGLLLTWSHHHDRLLLTLMHRWHHHAWLGRWRHHRLGPETEKRAAILRLIQVVEHRVHVVLTQTPRFDEVLYSKHVHTHLLGLLEELFFGLCEVAGHLTRLQGSAHAHLVRKLLSLHLCAGKGLNAALSHVTDKLSWQFI